MRDVAVRIIRAGEARRMPWKNGAGSTVEYAVHPPGAGLDNFAWRLSTADVVADGPFSCFAGVDRTLTILDGAGLRLRVGGAAPATLTPDTAPLAFPADAPTEATLLAGPVLDLNIMTRRGLRTHGARVMALSAPMRLDSAADTTLLFCRAGHVALPDGAILGPRDLAVVTTRVPLALAPQPAASLVVITIADAT